MKRAWAVAAVLGAAGMVGVYYAAPAKAAAKGWWALGIYTGPSPFQLSEAAGAKNPVLRASQVTDMDVDTLAHPFMVMEKSTWYLFFTAKHLATDKGGIGVAESRNGLDWKYRKAAVREPFVLSHPFVFKWQGSYYMIPEAHTEPSVRLYKATAFPDEWKYEGDLLKGDHYISPTLLRHKDMWWMFVSRPGNDNLRLFFARELKGPWTEHPKSPVIQKDLNTARPAGRPFVIDGTPYRLGQDCYPTYGNQVHAFRITALSPTEYAEQMLDTPVVKASGSGWNAEAMHHVDAHQTGRNQWIAVVDGLGQ